MNRTFKNDRLFRAVDMLLFRENDIRIRVADACYILKDINQRELSNELYVELQKILDDACKDGSFEETAKKCRKKTYVGLAKRIYAIHYKNELN